PGPRADSRRPAQPRSAANRMRLRTALPVREAGVYRNAAASARRGVRPCLPLSPRAGPVRVAARRPQQRRIAMTPLISFLAAVAVLSLANGAAGEGTLRIGMTAADIPYTGGQTDNGFEGFRFVGYQIYEPLINWDLSRGDKLPSLVPGLAESWEVSKSDPKKWIFKLRRNVKFHDGSAFNADAVLFTF